MNYKLVILIALAVSLFATGSSSVLAAGINETECTTNYGAYGNNTDCEHIDFIINKTIADPTTVEKKGQSPSNYRDNWGVNAEKYVPGQQVPFRISVTNTGTKTLHNIVIKDTMPQYIRYASGGSYDKKTKIVSFNIESLSANETKTVDLIGQIIGADSLPSDSSVSCTTNKATASVNNMTVEDNAQLCIIKESVGGEETKGGTKVFPAPKTKTTPPTGPEVLALLPLIGSGIAGLILRRRS